MKQDIFINEIGNIYKALGISFRIDTLNERVLVNPFSFKNKYGEGELAWENIEVHVPGDMPIPQTGDEGFHLRINDQGEYLLNYSERGNEVTHIGPTADLEEVLYFCVVTILQSIAYKVHKDLFNQNIQEYTEKAFTLSQDDRIFWMSHLVVILSEYNPKWAKRYVDNLENDFARFQDDDQVIEKSDLFIIETLQAILRLSKK